jgi:hypothetical protein
MTTTETRQIVSKLVAHCLDCNYWVSLDELGNICIGDGDCQRKLVSRRFWICSECSCSFKKRTDADNHICQECY